MRTGWNCGVVLAGLLAGGLVAGVPAMAVAVPATGAAPDPALAMRRIALQPFRYGGALQGTVPGLSAAVDQPPVHLSIGLGRPGPDGRMTGEAILFTADRHLVAMGAVDGQLQPGQTPGTGACTLHMMLQGQTVTLSGLCSADTLSGEIVTQAARVDLLTRLVSWWDDRTVRGRYWLTPGSFDPASS
jgi:hypothetical protein